MRSSVRVGVAAFVAVAALAQCSSSAKPTSTAVSTTSGTPSGTTSARTPAGATPGSFAALAATIITSVPKDFVRQPDASYDTGPSDLAKAVRDDGAANAASSFRTEGFVRGYQRLWLGPAQAQIIVFIYQFRTPTGARADYARGTKEFATRLPTGAHKFSVANLAAGQSVGIAGTVKDVSSAVVFFSTGVFNVQVNCNGPLLAGLQARVSALAQDQFRRLSR